MNLRKKMTRREAAQRAAAAAAETAAAKLMMEETVIVREILVRLPSVSLVRFRCVCKAWQAIIADPDFVRAHLSSRPYIVLPSRKGEASHCRLIA
ncbi:unnamed protein product [Urochloa humidicola]